MRTNIMIATGIIALAAGTWVTFQMGAGGYSGERKKLNAEKTARQNAIRTAAEFREKRPDLRNDIQWFANHSLGPNLETVDPRLRSELVDIAEASGLTNVAVTIVGSSAKTTPARSEFRGKGQLRDEIDFVEVHASVSAQGPLSAAMELIDRIKAAQWLKRIDMVNLDPKKEAEQIAVGVRLTTIFLPDQPPADFGDEPVGPPYNPQRMQQYQALVDASPFLLPPPEETAEPAAQPAPVAASDDSTFAYGQWKVTIVAKTPNGWEVCLRNTGTGQSRWLRIGQSIAEAKLVAAQGQTAEFELADANHEVTIGQSLFPAPSENR